jgi:hypothetical protein
MNKNVIGCIVLLCILFVTFILIKKRNIFLNNETIKNMENMENISPYVMLGSLKNPDKNVICVNTLGEKIPFLIDCVDSQNSENMTNIQFEAYLQENPTLQNVDLVILYCASWSCGAAYSYYKKMEEQGTPMKNVYDYKGALHEWAMYSLIFPELFLIKNLSTNNNANNVELKKLSKDMMHTYLLKDEKNSTNNIVVSLSNTGEILTNNF